MAAPVITVTTSLLPYKQGETWAYQPYATNLIANPQGSTVNLARRLDARAATTAALATSTYANGAGGIGATLTADATGALAAIDGVTLTAGDAVLVKNQAAALQNGLYLVTAAGSAGTPWILTRSLEMDAAAEFAGYVHVAAGTTNGGKTWLAPAIPITVGTTSVTFDAWGNKWTSSPLPAGLVLNPATGQISGAVTVAGVYIVTLTVTNANGEGSLTFPLAIVHTGYSTHTGVDMSIDVRTNMVSVEQPLDAENLFLLSSRDDLLLFIRWKRGDQVVSPTIDKLQMAVKELVYDTALELSTSWVMVGTGVDAYAVLHIKLAGEATQTALSNYEKDYSKHFSAHCQIEWVETNTIGTVPGSIRRTTQTFRALLQSDFGEVA